jgi:hypothetical protein
MKFRHMVIALVLIIGGIFFVSTREGTKKSAPGSSETEASANTDAGSCAPRARDASDALGAGLGRFVNPPVDLEAFESFHSEVETKIRAAEAQCSCLTESCVSVREALSSMRNLLAQMDASARDGQPLEANIVQEIEEIDRRINEAG